MSFLAMGVDEVKTLFNTQKTFSDSLVRIPITLLTNIDRIRTEHIENGSTIERSLRDLASSLRNKQGQSLQCDAENGGKDRNAYLFVPRHHVSLVKTELASYRNRL
jgi:hypothetical protein